MTTTSTTGRMPLGVRLAQIGSILGLVAVAWSIVVTDWWWLGASVVVLLASFGGVAVRLVGLVAALVTGAWPAAIAAVVSLLSSWRNATEPLPGSRSPLDRAALRDVLGQLPAEERRLAETAASGVVDSLALVRAAMADDPARWSTLSPNDLEGTGFDGGELDGTGWTVVACEAVLMASSRPDAGSRLDLHHVAGAAAILPNAAAFVRLRERAWPAAQEALGLSDGQLTEQFLATTKHTGSELIVQRAERLSRRGADSGELSPAEWRRLLRVDEA